ncbi:MAG: hypothetical protein ABIG93_04550 [archaeon]
MYSLQTNINKGKLEEWCKRLPVCQTFLENFFYSCKPYIWETNYLNYVHDIEVQTQIEPNWRLYKEQLMEAFVAITGNDEWN